MMTVSERPVEGRCHGRPACREAAPLRSFAYGSCSARSRGGGCLGSQRPHGPRKAKERRSSARRTQGLLGPVVGVLAPRLSECGCPEYQPSCAEPHEDPGRAAHRDRRGRVRGVTGLRSRLAGGACWAPSGARHGSSSWPRTMHGTMRLRKRHADRALQALHGDPALRPVADTIESELDIYPSSGLAARRDIDRSRSASSHSPATAQPRRSSADAAGQPGYNVARHIEKPTAASPYRESERLNGMPAPARAAL
jgi:hypothetical protein